MKLRRTLHLCKVVFGYVVEIERIGLRLLDLALERVEPVCKFFDVAGLLSARWILSLERDETHPLLGPRFMGCLLNRHVAPVLLQLEQASGPFSLVASHRICRT